MKKFVLILCVFFIFSAFWPSILTAGEAQKSSEDIQTDVISGPRQWWLPAGEILLLNGVLGAANYYIGGRSWAKIGTASIIENFELGFDWDTDGFPCNMLDHPYHGAMFYSMGRSMGYSFWESSLFPLLGALQWEYFMETERPSTNDLIMTAIGGPFFGEILFRSAVELLRAPESGTNGVGVGLAAFIASPPLWVNRRLYGDKISFYEGSSPFRYVRMGAGIGNAQSRGRMEERYNPILFIEAQYDHDSGDGKVRPFDYFTFDAQAEQIKNGNVLKRIETNGILIGSRCPLFNADRSVSGLFASYDYMEGLWYDRFANVGVGPGMFLEYEKGATRWEVFSGIYAIFGGASARYALIYGDTPYEDKDETYHFGSELQNGAYYLGPGFMTLAHVSYSKKCFSLEAGLRQFWVSSVHATDANEWGYFFPVKLSVKTGAVMTSLEYEFIHRHSFYDDYTPLYNDAFTLKLLLGYLL